jgi:hypothetical protein
MRMQLIKLSRKMQMEKSVGRYYWVPLMKINRIWGCCWELVKKNGNHQFLI